MPYYLFLVRHPAGEFIGVAKHLADARLHWGHGSEIEMISAQDILNRRAQGLPERVILAI
jgi:hypothetical protein